MNSSEAYKGFISFIILGGAVGLSILSFNYINNSTNLISIASNKTILPKYVEVNNISINSATINWYTNNSIIGVVIYAESKDCFEDKKNNYQNCKLISEEATTKDHQIKLNSLKTATTYYYKIKGDSYLYPEEDILSFSTSKDPQIPKTPTSTDSSYEDQDISGIEEIPLEYEGFSAASDEQVLGISTNPAKGIIKEFKDALIYNNPKYDFDKNGKVENADYPLFIQFIRNAED